MADGLEITPGTGATIAADDISGVLYQRVKIAAGVDGSATDVSDSAPLPVDDAGGSLTVDGPLTDDELRASDVAITLDGEAVTISDGGGAITVDGTVTVQDGGGSITVDGPLTDTQLRADDVAITLDGETVTVAASENLIGLVGASDIVVTVTPTVDTSAYSSGDLLFDSAEVANAVRANGGTCILQSVTIEDKADQGVAFTLVIANAATDFGTANSAPDPDDTESGTVIGWVPIATSDYIDLGANKVACVRNLGLLLKAGASTTSLYIAGVNGTGTPTYGAAGDLVIQLGFLRS